MEYWIYKDIKIPKLGFGTWMLQGESASKAVTTALDLGYRHIDTASMYRNEKEIGLALKQSSIPREKIFLTTKFWDNLSLKGIQQQTQDSLKNLQTDYVDLLLIHWPSSKFLMEEYLLSLQKIVQEGKTRFVGVSNFPSKLLLQALEICPSLITNQVEYHPFLQQQKILNLIDNIGSMFLTAYSPLGRGEALKSQQIQHIAKKYNRSPSQVILRWLIEQKNVVPIVKASHKNRMQQNLEIFDFQLEKEDQDKLHRLTNQNRRLVNPPFAPTWDD